MDVKGKHIVVFGLGRTGESLVRFLLDKEARVTVTDSSPVHRLEKIMTRMKHLRVDFHLGGHPAGIIADADLVVLSPGVPHTLECIEQARRKNIPIIGEIELAAGFIDTPVVAITGTNGKSTTTRLIGRMLEHSGKNVFLGGNLGRPLIDYATADQGADVAVVEVSSFQLDTIVHFRPKVGVLLNITPDHLDRYDDFQAYARSKGRLFNNHTAADTAVLNAGDAEVLRVTENIKSRRCMFNQNQPDRCGAVISDFGIRINVPDAEEMVVKRDLIPLVGRHNMENTAAAILAAMSAGASNEGVLSALSGFVPDPHRTEFVATVNSVSYYDDSKGTNVDATARAIEALSAPLILIAGGRDKLGGYDALREPVRKNVKFLIVIGESANAIDAALNDVVETRHAPSMAKAVQTAADIASAGDKVLLSPACSSFDMYENYATRGQDFQLCVRSLMRDAI